MKKTIKFVARTYVTKKGTPFTKLSVKGQYLPLAVADDDTYYQVRFTKDSVAQEPNKNGVYEVAFNDGDLWIDDRNETPVVRVRALKVVFDHSLVEKDVRAQ